MNPSTTLEVSTCGRRDRKDYASFFLNLSRTGGDLVPFRSHGNPAFLVNCPAHAEHVLSLNASNYENPSHPYQELSAHYRDVGSVMLQITRPANNRYIEETTLELTETARNISKDIQRLSPHGPVNLIHVVRNWLFCAISRLLFAIDVRHLSEAFVKASLFAEECWANSLFTPPSSSPSELEQEYHAAIQTQRVTAAWIAHEARIVPKDKPVSESVTTAIVRTLLNGYNATATSVCWTILAVLQRDEILKRLYKEIDSRFAKQKSGTPNFAQLDYLRKTIKETLRLYPPAWILSRRALSADRFGNTFIPERAQIFISPFTMHRHPRLWERSNEFIPERFDRDSSVSVYQYFPFGGGARHCPARGFVINHLQVLVSVLLASCDLELVSTEHVRPRGLIALHPQPDILVKGTSRDCSL